MWKNNLMYERNELVDRKKYYEIDINIEKKLKLFIFYKFDIEVNRI